MNTVPVCNSYPSLQMVRKNNHPESCLTTPQGKDKKRNRLNYARVPAACAPCHRRKTRCVLEEGGRKRGCRSCAHNGERCSFDPVNQQDVDTRKTQSPRWSHALANLPSGSTSALPGQRVFMPETVIRNASDSEAENSLIFGFSRTSLDRSVPRMQPLALELIQRHSGDLVDEEPHLDWTHNLESISRSDAIFQQPMVQHESSALHLEPMDFSFREQSFDPPTLISSMQMYDAPATLGESTSNRSVQECIASLQSLLAIGWAEDELLGPVKVDSDWLFVSHSGETVPRTMSRWISEIISTFEVLGVPEKLGLMVLYCRYFRWLVTKSPQDYLKIPCWMRPTMIQIDLAHEMWIDLIPWPGVRDLIVKQPTLVGDAYGAVSGVSGHLCLGWPFGLERLIDIDPETGTTYPSLLLEQHALDLGNWSLDPLVVSQYPFLTGLV